MNEQDQVELERLKRRQADLLAQFNELGRNLAALEARLAAGGTPRQAPMAAPPVIQTVAPTAIPIPSIAAPPPPIPAKEISVPLPRLEATASELPPVAPTGSPQTASAAPPTMPPPPLPPGDRSSSFELRL